MDRKGKGIQCKKWRRKSWVNKETKGFFIIKENKCAVSLRWLRSWNKSSFRCSLTTIRFRTSGKDVSQSEDILKYSTMSSVTALAA